MGAVAISSTMGAKPRRRSPLQRLEGFYHLSKRQAWGIDDLAWDRLPPVPGFDHERWRLVWASVVQQQLQADRIAIGAATRLCLTVPEPEARLYYSTMVQDEARHVEGWHRLAQRLDDVDAHNPYLAEMGQILREGSTLEEQVIPFQVCYEGAALHTFREIADAARSSVLGAMAARLVRDDAIHHHSGIAYAEHLLHRASPALKNQITALMRRYAPLYVESTLWRPAVRQWLGKRAAERDRQTLARNQTVMNQALVAIGLGPMFDL